MWYKYVDRASYDLVRVWRYFWGKFSRCNLKFNQDDNGMMKNKHPGFITEHIYRAARSEGPVPLSLLSSEDLLDS